MFGKKLSIDTGEITFNQSISLRKDRKLLKEKKEKKKKTA